ncbi:hypothetical protein HY415_01935 [Candidatus Kaiserbacteria bacterium]|nr:hypothetical protein [Candidatus Kaiserbacteria bacterium]
MIEVEVRGHLTDAKLKKLTTHLTKEGALVETQDREMILLYDYPGYSDDPIVRECDIRLRNTNGNCEIMVKHKSGEHNVARKETSLKLHGSDLTVAKDILKALGFSKGLWMHRKKEVYKYRDIEWSIVNVPHGLSYFEAEQEAANAGDTEKIREHLTREAGKLGFAVMNPTEMKMFIEKLDKTVNKEIVW